MGLCMILLEDRLPFETIRENLLKNKNKKKRSEETKRK